MLQARSQWIAILPSCVRLISAWVAGRFSAALISTRYATPIRATIATTRMRMRHHPAFAGSAQKPILDSRKGMSKA